LPLRGAFLRRRGRAWKRASFFGNTTDGIKISTHGLYEKELIFSQNLPI
jgi:hypothetical protein